MFETSINRKPLCIGGRTVKFVYKSINNSRSEFPPEYTSPNIDINCFPLQDFSVIMYAQHSSTVPSTFCQGSQSPFFMSQCPLYPFGRLFRRQLPLVK